MRVRLTLLVLLATAGVLPRSLSAQIITPSPQGINAASSAITDCAAFNCATWAVPNNAPSLTIGLVGTMTSMTVTFEATIDNITWVAIRTTKLGAGTQSTTTTATGQYAITNTGLVGVRVRCTTYVSGTVNATLSRGSASAALRLFDLSVVTGTLGPTNGGTGFASYTVGDLLSADTTTSLSKVADVTAGSYLRSGGTSTLPLWSTLILPNAATTGDVLMATSANTMGLLADVTAGSYLRSGGASTAALWSTLVLPNSATAGDLITATSTNTVGSVAAVATGQVLTSAGTGTVPAYSAAPSVTSVTAKGGSGTGTFKAGGVICSTTAGTCSAAAYSDASVQNQWNVMSVTLPASTLATNGDEIEINVAARIASNANAKEFQLFLNGGTCSGSSAACCSSGTSLSGTISSSVSNLGLAMRSRLWRTSSGNQGNHTVSLVSTGSAVAGNIISNVAETDTGTIPIVLCARNTAAAATTLQLTPQLSVRYFGQ